MPQAQKTYEFTDPESGMTLEVSGPTPPSEAILRQMFADARKNAPPTEDTPSVMESTPSKVARTIGNALPTVGGMAGGLAGSVGGPVPAIALSALGGAAGELGRQSINALRGRATQTPVQDALIEGAQQGGAEMIGAGVAKALSSGGRAVYRGYLKPSLSKQLAPRAERIVETAIEEGLPITESGREAGKQLARDLHTEVGRILESSDEQISLKSVAERVRAFAKQRYYKPGADLSDYKAALEVADRLDKHPTQMVPGPKVPKRTNYVDENGYNRTRTEMVPGPPRYNTQASMVKADEAKRALDAAITETQFGVTSGAQTTVEKAARHELNEQMRAATPAIKPLNERQSQLIDATKAIARAVGREANTNQLTGWRTMVSGGVAGGSAAYGNDPKMSAALGILMRGGLQPAVASRIAIIAVKASGQLGLGLTEAIRLALLAGDEGQE